MFQFRSVLNGTKLFELSHIFFGLIQLSIQFHSILIQVERVLDRMNVGTLAKPSWQFLVKWKGMISRNKVTDHVPNPVTCPACIYRIPQIWQAPSARGVVTKLSDHGTQYYGSEIYRKFDQFHERDTTMMGCISNGCRLAGQLVRLS